MSNVEELLAHYNPDGVNNVTLSSIGEFENIGVDKKIVEGEPLVTLLNYVDVYHNKTIKNGVPKMIVSSPVNKVDKCSVEKGDIFITPTSETVDDIGHSALVLETLPQTVYSYHIMRYRLHNVSMTTASYINQCFESRSVKEQIFKKAQGLTRFGVSKSKFGEIEIPLPHIKVQEEIVKILDSFTNLIDALNEELSLRQKQFEYYREKLLTFDNKVEHSTVIRKNENSSIDEIDMRVNNRVEELLAHYNPDGVNNVTLSSIGEFENIGVDKKIVEGEPLVTLLNYVDVYHNKTIKNGVPKMIVSSPVNKVDKCSVEKGDIFITPTSETVDDIGHSALVLETLPQTVYSYHIMRYRLHNVSMTTASYINQCFESRSVKEQILKKAQGLTRFGVSKNKFGEIEIPLPHIKVQEEIVEILDFFTNLIDALNEELSLRQKQYEYYREKLLTFD